MFDPAETAASNLVLLGMLMLVAWTDWQRWRIPNRLLVFSALLALVCATLAVSTVGLVDCLWGALVGGVLFLPLYLARGMAAGDVKLLAVVGMYVGPVKVVEIALASALVGGLWAVFLLIRSAREHPAPRDMGHPSAQPDRQPDRSDERAKPSTRLAGSRHQAIPYGVVMAIGTAVVLLLR